ncbi:MAG: hypothetical protein Q6370_006825, partial [Candidatus Sigynarchaeota archaeon]
MDHVTTCFQDGAARGRASFFESGHDLGIEDAGRLLVAGLGELLEEREGDVGVEKARVVIVFYP